VEVTKLQSGEARVLSVNSARVKLAKPGYNFMKVGDFDCDSLVI
jgi:hypothetical protein